MPSMNLLKIEPQAICIDKNTTGPASAKTVKVTNRSRSSSVGFGIMVQASAQKLFRAEPRMGTLKPGATQELTISLKCQAQVSDKAESHCIMLQAVKVEESESCTLTKETFNKAPKELVQRAKFRVTIGDSSADDVKDEEPSEKDGEDSFDEPQEEHQKAQAPARNGTPSIAASDDASLQAKYDELLVYKQMLENGREKLQEEAKRIREATPSAVPTQGAPNGGPYQFGQTVWSGRLAASSSSKKGLLEGFTGGARRKEGAPFQGWRIEHVVAVAVFVPLLVHSVKSWFDLFDV